MTARGRRGHPKIGQNFLIDINTAIFMCSCASIGTHDSVLEVGPGKGMLTRRLLEARPARLFVVEIDRRFSGELDPMSEANANLEVIWADALSVDYRNFFSPHPNKIVANIPYQITTELLWKILEEAAPGGTAYLLLMVQREAAERLKAIPGSRRSNPLSITLSKMATLDVLRTVPPQAFSPRPLVESAILQVCLKAPRLLLEKKWWRFFIETGFRQRRKTLLNNLKGGLRLDREEIIPWFGKVGIGLKQRAEELDLELWEALYEEWTRTESGRSPEGSARPDSVWNQENRKDNA